MPEDQRDLDRDLGKTWEHVLRGGKESRLCRLLVIEVSDVFGCSAVFEMFDWCVALDVACMDHDQFLESRVNVSDCMQEESWEVECFCIGSF